MGAAALSELRYASKLIRHKMTNAMDVVNTVGALGSDESRLRPLRVETGK